MRGSGRIVERENKNLRREKENRENNGGRKKSHPRMWEEGRGKRSSGKSYNRIRPRLTISLKGIVSQRTGLSGRLIFCAQIIITRTW